MCVYTHTEESRERKGPLRKEREERGEDGRCRLIFIIVSGLS